MSLTKCTSSGMREDCAMVRSVARQFAIGAAFIGGLNGLDGGLQLIGVFHRLRQQMHVRADRQHLPALARR